MQDMSKGKLCTRPMKASLEWKFWVASILFFCCCFDGIVVEAQGADTTESITAIVGGSVDLRCDVSSAKECGGVFNIKWYKSGSRVFIASLDASGRSEGALAVPTNRAEFFFSASPPYLRIKPVDINDEADYKCEITYTNLNDDCPTFNHIKLLTIARPSGVAVKKLGVQDPLGIGEYAGPYEENSAVELTCEARGAKPAAVVSWWNDTQLLGGDFTEVFESDQTFTSRNSIAIIVGRQDVLRTIICRTEHDALLESINTSVTLDVYVPPRGIELEFDEKQLYEGATANLTCRGLEARPNASVIWLNGTKVVQVQPKTTLEPAGADGHVVTTVSVLSFVASRFENGETFTCQVENNVTGNRERGPLTKSITLNVYYPPVVDLKPEGDLKLEEGSSVDVVCNYEAHPSNLTGVTWHKDDAVITASGDMIETTGVDPSDVENENETNNDDEDEDRTGDNAPRLILSAITRHHSGVYRCVLENAAGTTESTQFLNLTVVYPPSVKLIVSPSLVRENETDVELVCDMVDAFPRDLDRYQWLRNGQVIDETHNSTLLLPQVDRHSHGNYSCRGHNEVGWGNASEEAELDVLFPPGKAVITFLPLTVVKGKTVHLFCEVQDLGNPPVSNYKWIQGNTLISDVHSRNWTINPVTVQTRATTTCIPQNSAGDGVPASLNITVNAPPAFVKALDPFHGFPKTSPNVSMSCQVECWPPCEVEWLRNGESLTRNPMYTMTTSKAPAEEHAGPTFEAVVSTLRWNMAAWPGGKLDRNKDNANYTCRSSRNSVGPPVNSSTSFFVEYAPENITVTTTELNVVEGDIAPPVYCSADALPEPEYIWIYVSKGDEIPISGPVFHLNYTLLRDKHGVYACKAYNRHGNISVSLLLNVLYEPECHIEKSTENGYTKLSCVAKANPEEIDFMWLQNNKTVIDEDSEDDGYNNYTYAMSSVLTIDDPSGIYVCQVNNSVGNPTYCEIDTKGPGSWFEKTAAQRITLIAAIISAVIAVIILLVIIIICIRRRRDKSRMNMEPREGPDGRPQSDAKSGKSGRKPGVVTFRRVDPEATDVARRGDEASKKKRAPSPVTDGDRAFYENLPFHGLQPPPNKTDRPIPAPRAHSPTKSRHVYQNLMLPTKSLKSQPFKPELADLEYADVDFPPRQALNNNEHPPKALQEVAEEDEEGAAAATSTASGAVGNSTPKRPPRARPTNQP